MVYRMLCKVGGVILFSVCSYRIQSHLTCQGIGREKEGGRLDPIHFERFLGGGGGGGGGGEEGS